MEESDDYCEVVGDIDDDECDGSDVIREDDGKVDVPCLLIPFLNAILATLLSPSSSPSFRYAMFLSAEAESYSSWPHLT